MRPTNVTHTDEEIVAAAKTVVMLLTMFKERWRSYENWRWSRTTLSITQGWSVEERCQVFRYALILDPTSNKYGRSSQVDRNERERIRDAIQAYGDNGGIGEMPF